MSLAAAVLRTIDWTQSNALDRVAFFRSSHPYEGAIVQQGTVFVMVAQVVLPLRSSVSRERIVDHVDLP